MTLEMYQTRVGGVLKMTLRLNIIDLRHVLRNFLMNYNLVNKCIFMVGVRQSFLTNMFNDLYENTSYTHFLEVFLKHILYEGDITTRFFLIIF
jgi:hypothetical protein